MMTMRRLSSSPSRVARERGVRNIASDSWRIGILLMSCIILSSLPNEVTLGGQGSRSSFWLVAANATGGGAQQGTESGCSGAFSSIASLCPPPSGSDQSLSASFAAICSSACKTTIEASDIPKKCPAMSASSVQNVLCQMTVNNQNCLVTALQIANSSSPSSAATQEALQKIACDPCLKKTIDMAQSLNQAINAQDVTLNGLAAQLKGLERNATAGCANPVPSEAAPSSKLLGTMGGGLPSLLLCGTMTLALFSTFVAT